jgi:hypothetical protein
MKNQLGKKADEFGFETAKGYAIAIMLVFLIVPFAPILLGIWNKELASGLVNVLLLMANPMCVIIFSAVYSVRHGFSWKYPLFIGGVFLLSIFFFYNMQTVVHLIVYLILAFIGSFVGTLIYKMLGR